MFCDVREKIGEGRFVGFYGLNHFKRNYSLDNIYGLYILPFPLLET